MRKMNALKAMGRFFLASLLAGFATGALAETHHGSVAALSTDSWRVCAAANETTTVLLKGDGDTDLDLYVYDENEHLIVRDLGPTDYGLVQWTALWSGCFVVKVVNRGLVYNVYRLIIQ